MPTDNHHKKWQKMALAGATGLALLVSGTSAIALEAQAAFSLQDDKKPEAKPEKKPAKEDEDKIASKDADEKSDGDADDSKQKKKKVEKSKYKKLTEKLDKIDGMFTFFSDPKTGKIFMEINEDQLEKEYIYHSHVENGVLSAGRFKGQYGTEKVVKMRKVFNTIQFVLVNTNYHFDSENAIARAADANTSDGVIASIKINTEGDDKENKSYVIAADALFKSEALTRLSPIRFPGPPNPFAFKLGKINKASTQIAEIKSYDNNAYVQTNYVFTNPGNFISGPGVTDPRNISVRVQHSFIDMPDDGFEPRFDDQRVGYFLSNQTDLTDTSDTPYRDMVNRWRLVKKDPIAKVSEPVKPIVWWIENTTPRELRPIIKKAGEAWNIAFEAAGFKNALVVKEQPDDADWDAGDINYNVLRWTSSPQPSFGGYGPSFANPRTGELIGADIMLEYGFLRNRLRQAQSYETALLDGLMESTDSDVAAENAHIHSADFTVYGEAMKRHMQNCNMSDHLQMNNLVGKALARTKGLDETEHQTLVEQSLYYLILHEIGHTLGLNHNMRATQARSYETAHDKAAQEGEGLVGSVMDYPLINFAPDDKEQAYYYTVQPGAYDTWAIQFAYDPDLSDPAKRQAHLARSLEKGLDFGNDADDMRAPGKGFDPRVNVGDFSDDPVRYAGDRLKMDRKALKNLKKNFLSEGEGYQPLINGYLVVTADMGGQARTVSRYIGGVYADRQLVGQSDIKPYRAVPAAKQREAMALLASDIFAEDAFAVDQDLLQQMIFQRRGFSVGVPPRVHVRVYNIQSGVLAHLLHPSTVMRISDSQLYGNEYALDEMMGDLTDAIFKSDARGSVNTYRQQLQIGYVNRLIGMITAPQYDYVARSNALANLNNIRSLAERSRTRGNGATKAHRDHIILLIDKALEVYRA